MGSFEIKLQKNSLKFVRTVIRSVFRNPSNICDEAFLRRKFQNYFLKSTVINVWHSSKCVSSYSTNYF